MSTETHIHTCPLCEATCGLSISVDPAARAVLEVRGDDEDVFSRGFACPKGLTIGELHADPDRRRRPGDGRPAAPAVEQLLGARRGLAGRGTNTSTLQIHPADAAASGVVASAAGGTNPNVLTGPDVDPLSGNAILNGVPVEVGPAPGAAPVG